MFKCIIYKNISYYLSFILNVRPFIACLKNVNKIDILETFLQIPIPIFF